MTPARLLAPVSVLALLAAAPAAGASFNVTGSDTVAKTLASGETGTVTATGSLQVTGAHAISGAAAASIDNAGFVSASGINAAISFTGTVDSIVNSGTMTSGNWTVVDVNHWNGVSFDGSVGNFTNTATGKINGVADTTVVIDELTGAFVNRGEITNTSGDSAVFIRDLTGTFENAGLLEAASAAALNLGGTSGVTVVNSGTIKTGGTTALQLTGGGDTLTLKSTSQIIGKANGGLGTDTLKLDGTGTATFKADQLVSFESLEKAGSGRWTLTGINTELTQALISAGVLSVNGTLASMNVVLSGGTLAGTGRVGNVNLATGATIAPGNNSVGTLTVNDLIFGAGSIYDIDVAGGTADKIVALGTMDVSAGPTFNLVGGSAVCGNSTHIVAEFGALTGAIGDIVNNGPTYQFVRVGNTIQLIISNGSGRTFTGYTDTPNQAATAAALDALGCGNQPYAAQLNALTDAQVPEAMDALSGEGHAAIAAAMVQNANAVSGAVTTRLEQAFDKVASGGAANAFFGSSLLSPQTFEELNIWGVAYGGLSALAGNGNAAPTQSALGGLMAGADGMLNETWRGGLMAGLGMSSIASGGMQGLSFDAMWGAYAGAEVGVIKVKAGAAYTRHFISTRRAIVFPGVNDTVVASYQAGTAQGFVDVSTDIDMGRVTLTPFGRLEGVMHATDSFTETGGAGALTTAASLANALFATIGIGAEHAFVLSDTMLVTARGSVGWRHAFGSPVTVANSFTGGGPFTIATAGIASDVILINLGASVDVDDRTSLDVAYDGAFGSGLASHGVKATLSGKF